MTKSQRCLSAVALALVTMATAGSAAADEYIFKAAPQTDINRVYRVNRLTGEVGACQYALKDNSVGVTLCYATGEGAGPQSEPGDYDLVASSHEREGGIFRVNRRTGEMSVCYVLPPDTVVCTPSSR
ncbi:hypothetical protein GCM10007276_13630 [Agaricicola taiwanensis]|uniref:Secreted protein n=1 Tax=Agaricicola taiwanensis TaxID=591372 RepID=A0A8J2YEM2_9RHOB|nr:hypothetical protein [Agaricicola taiwanensis]GGE37488.1 hypothetical protein GCM10007276_13630 [Agaricicola taiwanensis]